METFTQEQPKNLIDLRDVRIQRLIMQSSSPSGYEREAALKEIKRIGSPQLLPTLIRRMNDWVQPVSALASDALIGLLRTENQADFIAALPDIWHLAKCGRRDHSHLINSVIEFFLDADQRVSLIDAIGHKNPKISAIAFNVCKERNLVPQYELLLLAIKSSSTAVIRGATHLINEIEVSEFMVISPQLIGHKCNAVASRSIKRLNLIAPQKVAMISADLIFSADTQIRAIARDHMSHTGADVLKIYRDSLSNLDIPLHKRRVALTGIYELQHDQAVEDLKQARIHNEPSIRAVAIPLLIEMMGDDGRTIAIDGMLDKSPSVVKSSARIFVKKGFQLSIEELLKLEQAGTAQNMFNIVLFLARKGNKWNHILILLEFLTVKHDEAAVLQSAINQWESKFNLSYYQPTPEQVRKLIGLHSKSEKTLSKIRWQNLKFIIDTLNF